MNKNTLFIQGRFFLPRCHLALHPALPPVTQLYGILSYSRHVTYALRYGILKINAISLTIPSVVHLTDCILPVLSTPGSL